MQYEKQPFHSVLFLYFYYFTHCRVILTAFTHMNRHVWSEKGVQTAEFVFAATFSCDASFARCRRPLSSFTRCSQTLSEYRQKAPDSAWECLTRSPSFRKIPRARTRSLSGDFWGGELWWAYPLQQREPLVIFTWGGPDESQFHLHVWWFHLKMHSKLLRWSRLIGL